MKLSARIGRRFSLLSAEFSLLQKNRHERQRAYQEGETETNRLTDPFETLLPVADILEATVDGIKLFIEGVKPLVQFLRLLLDDSAHKFFGCQRIKLAAQFADFTFVAGNLFLIRHAMYL